MPLKKIVSQNYLLLILIGLFLIFSLPTVSHYLINWDAGQFALGTIKYDLQAHQPQPPGYPLFVLTSRLLNYIFHNINFAFIAINFIAGLLAIFFLYKLILLISGSKATSFGVTLLFLFNPVFWYYHNMALTYTFDALALIWLSYLLYQTISLKKSKLITSLVLTAILIGFRPSIIIFAVPILVIQFIYTGKKIKYGLIGLGLAAILFLAWFIPFTQIIGGVPALLKLVTEQFTSVTALKHGSLFNHGQIVFLLESLILGFNFATILVFCYLPENLKFLKDKKVYLLLIAPVIMILFYICFHFGEVGYTLSILPSLYLLIAYPLEKIFQSKIGKILIILLAIIEVVIFLLLPPIFHTKKVNDISYKTIFEHDLRIQNYLTTIKAYKPDQLLLVALRGQYYDTQKQIESYKYDDIRTLSYYLPQYQIYDFMGVKDFYSLTSNYTTTDIHSSQIMFAASKNRLLILADYLHPDIYPQKLDMAAKSQLSSPFNFYQANISELDQFKFYGFNWSRQ